MIKKLYVKNIKSDYNDWIKLLHQEGIRDEETVDETFGIYDQERLVATASRYHNIIKCVAIDSQYQGGSYFNTIISYLITRNTEQGFFKHYVYTRKKSQASFEYLGFKALEHVDDQLVFMEKATGGFDSFLEYLAQYKVNKDSIASLVMNANPFTLGHQFLVEKAAFENDHVYIFVLSENMSVFDTQSRIDLVKKGVSHLSNITVLETDNYMVSNATFPSYFLDENVDTTSIQARLDARIFVHHIAKVLNITKRYVGEEPYSVATSIYNEALKKEFKNDLNLIIVERKITHEEDIISATRVRELWKNGDLEALKNYVPSSTYEYLSSTQGQALLENMKEC